MKKLSTSLLILFLLFSFTGQELTLAAVAPAGLQVGADCTNPPNLVPFADLSDCDLSGMDLDSVNLSNANLSGANLDGANLFAANVVGANFSNASLRATNLEFIEAINASFIGSDLRGANLYFAYLPGTNFSDANISNTWLSSIDFIDVPLQNTVFTGSTLNGVNFTGADLSGADLSATTLWYVTFSNADLRNASFLGAKLRSGTSFNGATWGNTLCADGSNSDDNDGDNFTCTSNFPANQPPSIVLTSPSGNLTVNKGDTVTISADAVDNDGQVIRVEFYAGATLLNMDLAAPYSFIWTTTTAGTFLLTARAYDTDNAVSTSQSVTVNVLPSANNQPPSVSITSPKNNATVYRLFGTTIKASASDPDGIITKVEFYAGSTLLNTDTSAPYSFYWKPTSSGNQTLTVKAYDDNGAVTTSSPVAVRVR